MGRVVFYSEFKNNPNNALQNFENNPNQLDNWIQTKLVNNILDNFVQSSLSIDQKLSRSFNEIEAMTDLGKKFELKTAKKLNNDGIQIKDLGNEIKGDIIKPFNNGQPIAGDRDISSPTYLIECKTTLSNRSANEIIEQLGKMIGDTNTPKSILKQFINPESKKIVLYTEESLIGINTNSLNQIKNYVNSNSDKIKIIDNYDDLLLLLR